MKKLTKNIAAITTGAYLLVCLAPSHPCYGMETDEVQPSALAHKAPPLKEASPLDGSKSWSTTLREAADIPLTFFLTLFSPTNNKEDALAFFQGVKEDAASAFAKAKEQGLPSYLGTKGKGAAATVLTAVRKDPLEAVVLSGGILLTHTNVKEYIPSLSSIASAAGLIFVQCLNPTKSSQNALRRLAIPILLESLFSPVAAEFIPCPHPQGSWKDSCHNITLTPYISTDLYVPTDSCLLRTQCNTIIPSIPPCENSIYFQATSGLNLGNNNGTLVIQSDLGSSTSISDIKQHVQCLPLPGSHKLSCTIKAHPYKSTDPNLQTTSFCQMYTECSDLDGKRPVSNTVYYGHEELRGQSVVVENCDGKAVIHTTKESDGMCSGVDAGKIHEISKEKGSTSHVVKRKGDL
jgi:hypothetical protein